MVDVKEDLLVLFKHLELMILGFKGFQQLLVSLFQNHVFPKCHYVVLKFFVQDSLVSLQVQLGSSLKFLRMLGHTTCVSHQIELVLLVLMA